MNLEPLADKWRAFGWEVFSVDGHDIPALLAAFELRRRVTDKPVVMICHTVKGKGVSFMENDIEWHCCKISQEEHDKAIAELEAALALCRE